jgi:tetratricopeptide repeat protein
VAGYTALGDAPGLGYANGMVAYCAGRLDEAATALSAQTAGSRKVDALLGLALVSAMRGDAAAAATYYRQVLAVEPSNPEALIGLGQLGGANAHASPPAASPAGSN